jgi:CubicO group peptidase (beta-lactamase class C family)
MRIQRRFGTVALLVAAALAAQAALQPPVAAADDQDWPRWATPEEASFSSAAVAEAEEIWLGLEDAPIAAFLVVYKGRILASFGHETAPFWCHSMRKSFLSALFGRHVANGAIDLDRTLEQLGIDDSTPLTAAEKQAKVVHLLKARSGVYIEAACESAGMKDVRPPRGSHPPDTFWYYNNWDFNVLGTIFRQETGLDIFDEFQQRIGRPIGMQDFHPAQCEYVYEENLSQHPCYTFKMSARDRARFGQLFLQNGRWGERQIVPEEWVAESTRAYSQSDTPGLGYGYMWWTHEPDFMRLLLQDARLGPLWGFAAHGYGGQAIFVFPDADIVAVFAVDVWAGGDLDLLEIAPLLRTILTGREIVDLRTVRSRVEPRRAAPGDALRLVARLRNMSDHASLPTAVDFYLVPERRFGEGALWMGREQLAELAPGMRKTLRLRTKLPPDLAPGKYYAVALADRDKANYDLDRANNLRIGRKVVVE